MTLTDSLLGPLRQIFQEIVAEHDQHSGARIDSSDVFRLLMEDMPEAFVITDPEGAILYANHAFCDSRNTDLPDVVGSKISDMSHGDYREESLRRRERLKALTPEDRVLLHDFTMEDGQRLSAVYKGWFDAERNLVAVSAVARDQTAAYRYEQRLTEANRQLQESNRDLQDFAYVASHDLQEPLRKISAFAGRLETKYADVLDEKGLDYLHRVVNASTRMQTLIADLLAFSRVQTQGSAFAACDLSKVISGVLADLEVAIEESGATISVGSMPTVNADASQMRQLFQNLIGNALKFRREGVPPLVELDAFRVGSQWEISVKDNGIGFAQKHAEKIFTVFQRLHARTEYEGSGVGLSVCRRIVERHAGSLRVSGEPGLGAVFTIVLPG